jgi:hypothetical protein
MPGPGDTHANMPRSGDAHANMPGPGDTHANMPRSGDAHANMPGSGYAWLLCTICERAHTRPRYHMPAWGPGSGGAHANMPELTRMCLAWGALTRICPAAGGAHAPARRRSCEYAHANMPGSGVLMRITLCRRWCASREDLTVEVVPDSGLHAPGDYWARTGNDETETPEPDRTQIPSHSRTKKPVRGIPHSDPNHGAENWFHKNHEKTTGAGRRQIEQGT